MTNRFDILFSSVIKEQQIVTNSEDANTTTSYDIIQSLLKRMIEDPRKLLPPVQAEKYIEKDKATENAFKFDWRFGKNIFVEIKVTPDNVFIYDIKQDKLIYSTPTNESPEHEVQNTVFLQIDKLVKDEETKQDVGVETPLELGNTNKSNLPGAEREPGAEEPTSKTSEYLKALKK